MKVPLEILNEIASYLSSRDLANFRLASFRCAQAGRSVIPRNGISVLSTFDSLQQLREFVTYSTIPTFTRHIRFFYGEWPQCARKEWEMHPLLFGGNDRSKLYHPTADEAFACYMDFMNKEKSRRIHSDVETIHYALSLLSNLRTVDICHIQVFARHPSNNRQYYNLQKKIWIAPFVDVNIAPAVQQFLLALGSGFCNIQSLSIQGRFDPSYLTLRLAEYSNIRKLHISSLILRQTDGVAIQFLQAFPLLVDLSLETDIEDSVIPRILKTLYWPYLRTVFLGNIWASEEDLFQFFRRHNIKLKHFAIENAALTAGSWKGLFGQIRGLKPQTLLHIGGELYGRRSKDSLSIDKTVARKIQEFMKSTEAQWPFGSPKHIQ
ncbi:hypothetical protein B0O99DRAFT_748894 [Bisporella sp. PMI_857]|nr:hypothetical protein B0O99DRAFT_748894 [Bisporella sp. PMI_857]